MRYAILMLMLISAPCWAAPTGTVTRSVMTDSNGVLIGWASNLVTANGIATTAQLAEVSGDLGAISNLAASALATGVSAQATADSAMATGTAAMAALSGYAPTNEPVFSGNVSIESITNSSTSVVFRVAIELPVGTHLLSDSYVKMSGLPGMPVWPGYLWNSNGHVMVSP